MALPLIIDCDPGHDDAIALILALASPELEVRAVTTSAGNQTPEKPCATPYAFSPCCAAAISRWPAAPPNR